MPQEKEDREVPGDAPLTKQVISADTTRSSIGSDKEESRCDEAKEDNVSLIADEGTDGSLLPEDMIVLDTTAESSVEEISGTSYELLMPEGVCLDTGGGETSTIMDRLNESQTPIDVVPSYDTDFAGVLTDIEYSMLTGKRICEARPKKQCFNCSGDHNISECSEPQDAAKIATNRKKYRNTRVSNVRYHEDSENKYGQFQPGKLSENLRHALGLKPYQLPLFIYRMRVLGYPPGWLLDAEVHQANVKMYDGSGKSVSHPDTEDGEAEPTSVKYKPERLVSFPGFNDAVPQGIRDEWQRYNFPPMQHHHQRTEFLRFMNMNKAEAYRKKKLKDSELRSNVTGTSSSEMEVDESGINKGEEIEFNPPLPEEPLPPPPPLECPSPPQVKAHDVEDGEICEDSQTSLSDLEAKRLKILRELEESISQNASAEGDKHQKDKNRRVVIIAVDEQAGENSEDSRMSDNSTANLSQSENSGSEFHENDDKHKCHHRSHSKGFKLGAVIPESSTSCKVLPDSEKWTVDVSDHINFENLPDALGTWNKMKGVMSKVKQQMHELHNEED